MYSEQNLKHTPRLFFSPGMVSALDEAVGNITDALRRRGFMNDTLIVFTTDVSGTRLTKFTRDAAFLFLQQLLKDHVNL